MIQIEAGARRLQFQANQLHPVLTEADTCWSKSCTSPDYMAKYFAVLFSALPRMWSNHNNTHISVTRDYTLLSSDSSLLESQKAAYHHLYVQHQLTMIQGVRSCSKITDALGTYASEMFEACITELKSLDPTNLLYENKKRDLYHTMLSLTHYLGMIKHKNPNVNTLLKIHTPALMEYLNENPTAVIHLTPPKASDDLQDLDSFVETFLSGQEIYLNIISLLNGLNSCSPQTKAKKNQEIDTEENSLAVKQASLQELGDRITRTYNSILGRDLTVEPVRFSVAAALFKLYTCMSLIHDSLTANLTNYCIVEVHQTAVTIQDEESSKNLYQLSCAVTRCIESSKEVFYTPTSVAEIKKQIESYEHLQQEQAEAHLIRCARFAELLTHISTLPAVSPQHLCVILNQLIENLEENVLGLNQDNSNVENTYSPAESVAGYYDQDLFKKTTAVATSIKNAVQLAQADPGKYLLRAPFHEVLPHLLQLNITNYPHLIALVSNHLPAEQRETYTQLLHLLQERLPPDQFAHIVNQLELYRLEQVPLNDIITHFLSHISQNDQELAHFLLAHLLSINRLSILYVNTIDALSKHISATPALSQQLSPLHYYLSNAYAQFYDTIFPTLCQYVHTILIPSLGELTHYAQQVWLPKQTLSDEDAQIELAILKLQNDL